MYTEGHYLVSDVVVSSVLLSLLLRTSPFRCREALDKNGTLIGEEMYDYQKELEHKLFQTVPASVSFSQWWALIARHLIVEKLGEYSTVCVIITAVQWSDHWLITDLITVQWSDLWSITPLVNQVVADQSLIWLKLSLLLRKWSLLLYTATCTYLCVGMQRVWLNVQHWCSKYGSIWPRVSFVAGYGTAIGCLKT